MKEKVETIKEEKSFEERNAEFLTRVKKLQEELHIGFTIKDQPSRIIDTVDIKKPPKK